MLNDAKHIKRFLLVRYEDFVRAPRESLARIAEFLALRPEDVCNAYQRVDYFPTDTSQISIRDMNVQSISRLDEEELRLITREAGDLLVKMGYARLAGTQ
jgi:hypothetical protein